MKHAYYILLIWLIATPAWAIIGYDYAPQALPIQTERPIAAPFAARPEMVYAVSGNLQPFGVGAEKTTSRGIYKAPPSTGKDNPDTPGFYTPVGDMDIVCWLALLFYVVLRAKGRLLKFFLTFYRKGMHCIVKRF